jgi:hypothetical protein
MLMRVSKNTLETALAGLFIVLAVVALVIQLYATFQPHSASTAQY